MIRALSDAIAQTLRVPGDFLRETLSAVPLSAAKLLFLAIPGALLLWILLMDSSRLRGRIHENGRIVNLKPFIVLALVIQVLIYALL